jgi:hypothetical protein
MAKGGVVDWADVEAKEIAPEEGIFEERGARGGRVGAGMTPSSQLVLYPKPTALVAPNVVPGDARDASHVAPGLVPGEPLSSCDQHRT